jgi:hypothetical protein
MPCDGKPAATADTGGKTDSALAVCCSAGLQVAGVLYQAPCGASSDHARVLQMMDRATIQSIHTVAALFESCVKWTVPPRCRAVLTTTVCDSLKLVTRPHPDTACTRAISPFLADPQQLGTESARTLFTTLAYDHLLRPLFSCRGTCSVTLSFECLLCPGAYMTILTCSCMYLAELMLRFNQFCTQL